MPKVAGTEVAKLRVKIGPHEFEAEGPHHVVATHFETWKQLIAARPLSEGATAPPRAAAGTPAAGDLAGRDIFAADSARQLITLQVSPGGKTPYADAALLILYGYRQSFDQDGRGMLATRLKAAMAASGHGRARVDRTLARHLAARLVRRTGRRKGSTYELTPTGYQRAEGMARALRATLQSAPQGA